MQNDVMLVAVNAAFLETKPVTNRHTKMIKKMHLPFLSRKLPSWKRHAAFDFTLYRRVVFSTLLLSSLGASEVHAETWFPSSTTREVVPKATGLGQQTVVDNEAGGRSRIVMQEVVRALSFQHFCSQSRDDEVTPYNAQSGCVFRFGGDSSEN